ncbi:MAG: hypothetical protein LN590_00260 [Rickettsia endosymbiont of Glossina mortisans submortisans]|nr:hypothetical protein [Rickettsia endosymbiont of Glossina mortisans submortisans]
MFSLWANYKMTDRHEEAANIILQMPLGNVKYLLEMLNNLYEINKEKLNLIDINTLLLQYLPMLNCCKYIAKYNSFSDKERSVYKEELKQELKEIFKFLSDKLLILSTALYTKQVEVAHDVLKTIPKKDMQIYKNFAILQSYLDPDSILYDESEFKEEVIVEILNTASTSLMAEEKTTAVLKNIEKSLKYDPQNEETLKIGIATSLLNNNKEKAREYANQLTEEKQQEISANYSIDNKAENIEELIKEYDAKEIHAHYQRVKQQKLFEISQKITNNQIINSWNVNKQIIKKDDAYSVGKYKGLNCFAKIAKKVEKKLDKNLIDSFTRAIEKGITYCKTSVNRVKFLQNKAVEVKIDCEMRLFTDIFYKNSQEELLLNFDHYGNHNEVENFANNHKLVEALGDLTVL